MNETHPLWSERGRVKMRVVVVVAMDTTALLLIWAFLELVCSRERRREGILFILKVCYISSVIVTILFINIALYLHPLNAACPAVVSLGYVCVICSLSWSTLTSLQRLLMSRHLSPEQITSQNIAIIVTVLYLVIGYGVPCSGLVTLLAVFYPKNFIAKNMCWLSCDAVWWLIVPVIFFLGGSYGMAVLAFRFYRETPQDVRCFLYWSFLLSLLLGASMVMIQVDLAWPATGKGYLFLAFIVFHNIIVWFHLTDTIVEMCSCARSSEDSSGLPNLRPTPHDNLHSVIITLPSSLPSRDHTVQSETTRGRGHLDHATDRGLAALEDLQSSRKNDMDKTSESDVIVDDMGASEEEEVGVKEERVDVKENRPKF